MLNGTNPVRGRPLSLSFGRISVSDGGLHNQVSRHPTFGLQATEGDVLVDKLPTWKGRLMRRNGHLILVKSTLQPIPMYASISLRLPPWVIKALEKIFTRCVLDGYGCSAPNLTLPRPPYPLLLMPRRKHSSRLQQGSYWAMVRRSSSGPTPGSTEYAS
jgi:hypothetical protein